VTAAGLEVPKKVSYTVVGLIVAQLITGAVAVTTFRADVTRLQEQQVEFLDSRKERRDEVDRRIDRLEGVKDRVVAVETELRLMRGVLERLETKFDRAAR
jgi:hypothetical protein